MPLASQGETARISRARHTAKKRKFDFTTPTLVLIFQAVLKTRRAGADAVSIQGIFERGVARSGCRGREDFSGVCADPTLPMRTAADFDSPGTGCRAPTARSIVWQQYGDVRSRPITRYVEISVFLHSSLMPRTWNGSPLPGMPDDFSRYQTRASIM